jgi:tetratricopeptide (TPR) repeat protein
MTWLRWVMALVLLCGMPATTSAAPRKGTPSAKAPAKDPKKEKQARGEFEKAERAFNLGRFQEALTGYRAAYDSLPLPAFLFNIAQCYRNLGDGEQAIFFYQRYLSLEPDAPNRNVVEELVVEQRRQLEAKQAEAAAAKPVDLTPQPEPIPSVMLVQPAPKTTHISPKWWLAGVLGVALLGGVAILVLRGGGSPPSGALGHIDAR